MLSRDATEAKMSCVHGLPLFSPKAVATSANSTPQARAEEAMLQ